LITGEGFDVQKRTIIHHSEELVNTPLLPFSLEVDACLLTYGAGISCKLDLQMEVLSGGARADIVLHLRLAVWSGRKKDCQ